MKVSLWRIIVILNVLLLSVYNYGEENRLKAEANPPTPYMEHQLILIPGGTFVMGVELPPQKEGEKIHYMDNAAHKVELDSFYVDKYEVTNYQYFVFCQATGRKFPLFWGMHEFHCGLEFPNHPVVGVSYADALEYAKWKGMRLPTEAEWEYAARGGLVGKKYANGDELDDSLANYGKKQMGTTPVGSFPPNDYGICDVVGNVREWVADYFKDDYYSKSPLKNPQGPEIGRFRVIRGGSWLSGSSCVRVDRRNMLSSNWVDFAVGFRCAKDVRKAD